MKTGKLVRISLLCAAALVLAGCPSVIGSDDGVDADGSGDPGVRSDAEAVAQAIDELTLDDFSFSSGDSASAVTTDFQVPTVAGPDGVALSWGSSLPARAETGTDGAVAVRRAFIGGDAPVTLTVTASKGVATASRDFVVTVLAKSGVEESTPVLRASDAQTFDDFGFSVGIGDGYAIVGAPNEDTDGATSGAAYVFVRDGSGWSEAAILKASNPGAGDEFGWSVAMDGDVAVVGAPGEDGEGDAGPSAAGAAYVFERTATGWDEVAILRASDAQFGDQFGLAVAVGGDVVIVGAPEEDGGSGDPATAAGAAYVFRRTGTGWVEETVLRAAGLQAGAELGYSVGISGDYAIAGAPYRDASDFDEGAAYLFEYDGTGWSAEPILIASDARQSDQFGYSVSISGDHAIVGAHFEDGGTGDPASAAGAAYAFSRGPSGWSETDILRASDAASMSYFGRAVSVYGDYAIVGAHSPASFAGAAYLFSLNGLAWDEESILTASDAAADDVFGWSVAIGPDAAIVGAPENEEGAAYVFE